MGNDCYLDKCKAVKIMEQHQNPTMLYVPNLETHTIWDTSRFGWVKTLESSIDIIRSELQSLLKSKNGFSIIYPKSESNIFQTDSGAWAVAWFFIYGKSNNKIISQCPQTAALLKSIPTVEVAGLSLFSTMMPGTHLQAHCGTTNAKLRVNLPLITEDSTIRVGNQTHRMKEGEVFIFDDSFEHEVFESGSKPRFSLLFDIYHPSLNDNEINEIGRKINPVSSKRYDSIMNNRSSKYDLSWIYK